MCVNGFFELPQVGNADGCDSPARGTTRSPAAALTRFRDDDAGGMIMFVIALFIVLAVAAGMGIDFIRHESARADLQNALDRGVLAATDITVKVDDTNAAKAIVQEYLTTRQHDYEAHTLDLAMPPQPVGRSIEARADSAVATIFLPAFGVNTLPVPAYSSAVQGAERTEIVLVLDVSGSMLNPSTFNEDKTKLDDLKDAAENFIDAVLTDETRSRTLVSIVPYSAQVNAGALFAGAVTFTREHNHGTCFDYDDLDFTRLGLDGTKTYTQHHHFIERTRDGENVYGCPAAVNEVLAYSNVNADLKGRINGLKGEHLTSIYLGMKWASTIMDPSSSDEVATRITAGLSSDFTGWPLAYDASLARKVVVLMTDGRNTHLRTIKDDPWAELGFDHFNVTESTGSQRRTQNNNDTDVTRTWTDADGNSISETDGAGNWALRDACDAFKDRAPSRNLLYTIGFELDDSDKGKDAKKVLSTCATSPATTFIVDGLEIETAFQAIVADLEKLRLTQ
ncbi:MAG: pilus assembly protein TadG-related protein [Pseudomonadota bacterium]